MTWVTVVIGVVLVGVLVLGVLLLLGAVAIQAEQDDWNQL